ncbi:MAG: DUF4115 domain-containing protein [Candidatus Ancaeobacter aquaticus]|nr:DUF4115 domain-containing protein [Candidatus Ancaeobacter aquaticus]
MENLHDLLKRTREEKGINIEDVSKHTKIRVKILVSIESGDYEAVASPTYLKGFIKLYSKYLGLDTKQIMSDYADLFQNNIERYFVTPGKVKDTEKTWSESMLDKFPTMEFDMRKFIFVVSVVLCILIGTISFFVVKKIMTVASDRPRQPAKEMTKQKSDLILPMLKKQTSQNIIGEVKNERLVAPAVSGVAQINVPSHPAEAVPKREQELHLTAEISQDVWLRIKIDGQLVFEDTLKNGEKETWKAKKSIEVRMGNAGGISLTLNDVFLGVQGNTGQVKSILIDHELLKQLKDNAQKR